MYLDMNDHEYPYLGLQYRMGFTNAYILMCPANFLTFSLSPQAVILLRQHICGTLGFKQQSGLPTCSVAMVCPVDRPARQAKASLGQPDKLSTQIEPIVWAHTQCNVT